MLVETSHLLSWGVITPDIRVVLDLTMVHSHLAHFPTVPMLD